MSGLRRDAHTRRADVHIGPNEVLRFALELAALAAMAFWAWTSFDGLAGVGAAILVPLAAAAAWGTFRVPNDPGPAPVAVPGSARLVLEAVFFSAAAAMLYLAGQEVIAVVFAALVILHYAVGRRRVAWLLRGGQA